MLLERMRNGIIAALPLPSMRIYHAIRRIYFRQGELIDPMRSIGCASRLRRHSCARPGAFSAAPALS